MSGGAKVEVGGPEVLKPTTELDLVLRCVTAALSRLTGAVEPSQIVWDGPAGFDEHRFLRLCRHHRVTPLVSLVIKRLKPGLSSWLIEVLRDQSRREAQWNLWLKAELVRLAGSLRKAGVESVVLKGPAVAELLYGGLACRPSGDLDLLIRREELPAAVRALKQEGYIFAHEQPERLRHPWKLRTEYHLPLIHPERGVSVELHAEVAPHWFVFPLTTAEVFEEAEEWYAGEESLWVPGDVHTALILLAHGTKHLWNRLIYLTDFALACVRLQEEKQQELLIRFKELRFLRAFKLAQALKQLLLDRNDAGLLSAGQDQLVLIKRIMGWLESGREFTRAELAVEQAKMHLALKECWSDRLKYAWRMGVVPNWDELEAWPTSPLLFWLYYIYRPLRLWRRYGLRALREIASKA